MPAARKNKSSEILQSEVEDGSTLFVLYFIPSKTKDGEDLPSGQDQQMWANAAGKLLAEEFGGATEMPPAKGMWSNDDGKIIQEKIILVHSYAKMSDAQNEEKIARLARFLHRMGKMTKQGEVGVVIDSIFFRIRRFTLADKSK